MSKSDRERKADGCVWCVKGAGGESVPMTVIGAGECMYESVCLGEEVKVPVECRKKSTRWREQRDEIEQRDAEYSACSDGSEPYLFYRGAVHCVMLDEKE